MIEASHFTTPFTFTDRSAWLVREARWAVRRGLMTFNPTGAGRFGLTPSGTVTMSRLEEDEAGAAQWADDADRLWALVAALRTGEPIEACDLPRRWDREATAHRLYSNVIARYRAEACAG